MSELTKALAAEGAPPHIAAAFEALQFRDKEPTGLADLSDKERQRFSNWCDVRQVSLMLPAVCGSELPGWVGEQLLPKAARYEVKFERLKRNLVEIVRALNEAGLEFVMLKGLSHAPALTPDARLRAQGDIDLWLIGPSVYEAGNALRGLGYVPLLNSKSRHLDPMGQPSSWRWRGDLFDPEMPISVELHYELWDEDAENIDVPGLEQFWSRRVPREFDDCSIDVLCDEDLLGFACLHFILHLLHGELPLQRAWEIAHFLDAHAEDDVLWASWRALHEDRLRTLESSVFYLVSRWFGCRVNPLLQAEYESLPGSVRLWLREYCLAPLVREWSPNKSEIWLHLALMRGKTTDKVRLLARKLLPTSLPAFGDRALPESSSKAKIVRSFRQLRYISLRLVRHCLTFLPTLFDGMRWLYLRISVSSVE